MELLWEEKSPYNGCLLLEKEEEGVVVGERRGTEPVRRRADFIAEKGYEMAELLCVIG